VSEPEDETLLLDKHTAGDHTLELKRYPFVAVTLGVNNNDVHLQKPQKLSPNTSMGSTHILKERNVLTRMKGHADLSTITLLTSNEAGLELFDSEEEAWKTIPFMKGAVLMNTGDILQGWSEGRFTSTKHRVINSWTRSTPRYSLVYFCTPDWHVGLDSLELQSTAASSSSRSEADLFGDIVPFT